MVPFFRFGSRTEEPRLASGVRSSPNPVATLPSIAVSSQVLIPPAISLPSNPPPPPPPRQGPLPLGKLNPHPYQTPTLPHPQLHSSHHSSLPTGVSTPRPLTPSPPPTPSSLLPLSPTLSPTLSILDFKPALRQYQPIPSTFRAQPHNQLLPVIPTNNTCKLQPFQRLFRIRFTYALHCFTIYNQFFFV